MKMVNTYWEDQNNTDILSKKHKEVLEGMNLPQCLLIKCRHCGTEGDFRNIRSIALMLNTKNIKDIAFEYWCKKCSFMENIYVSEVVDDIEDYIKFLRGDLNDKFIKQLEKSLTQSEMFFSNRNNILDNF